MKWCFFRSALACVLSLNMAMPVISDWSISPVVGGVIGSGEVLKNQVISSLSYSATLSRDIALFTIAGVTLDAYIVALSLDAKDESESDSPIVQSNLLDSIRLLSL